MRISGFTAVRNAQLLNYPFEESVRSILPICDEFIINCGYSDDDTFELCQALQIEFPKRIRILRSNWETTNQQGGKQLSDQTNLALAECKGDWCFYIQADEVVHEADLPKIKEKMDQADNEEEADGLVFDYRHFYASYDYTIRGRNWYRREVRAFKNGRGIVSFRDAQGFRRNEQRIKAIRSGAFVFHYGYVRTPDSMRVKSAEMAKWWGDKPVTDPEFLKPVRHIGLRKFKTSHPAVMAKKIKKENVPFNPRDFKRRWNRDEIKNVVTLLWESVFPWRIGEYRNYDLL